MGSIILISMTDEELVKLVQSGDMGAYEQLVRRYQRKLWAFVVRISRDEHEAEDVVYEALLALYKNIDRVDINRRFSTYMFQIAKNLAISKLRQRKVVVNLDRLENELAEDEKVYEQVVQNERKSVVREAVLKLAKNYQKVIELYYFEDLDYATISQKLKLPLNTVRTNLRRARARLAGLLADTDL